MLIRLDGPPPLETVTISRAVQSFAIRAIRELRDRRRTELWPGLQPVPQPLRSDAPGFSGVTIAMDPGAADGSRTAVTLVRVEDGKVIGAVELETADGLRREGTPAMSFEEARAHLVRAWNHRLVCDAHSVLACVVCMVDDFQRKR